jgi:hypothetical protein
MLKQLFTAAILACISLTPAYSVKASNDSIAGINAMIPSQRTVAISKISAKSASQAILLAERKNPGWKVVNVKEHSQHWGITMKQK